MILELDIGNSRIKWRTLPDTSAVESGAGQQAVAATMDELLPVFATLPPPRLIRLASVRHDDSVRSLADWTASHWGMKPQLAIVSRDTHGVTNSYSEVSQMGVDRWLAMLAGYHRTRSDCVVIDAGTALTVDVVAATGQHLGGYILPGLQLALQSLENHTRISLADRQFRLPPVLGKNTDQAVLNGVLAQVLGLVHQLVRQLADTAGQPAVLLSGGDAPLLLEALSSLPVHRLEICPSLVLDGLSLAETEEYGKL